MAGCEPGQAATQSQPPRLRLLAAAALSDCWPPHARDPPRRPTAGHISPRGVKSINMNMNCPLFANTHQPGAAAGSGGGCPRAGERIRPAVCTPCSLASLEAR